MKRPWCLVFQPFYMLGEPICISVPARGLLIWNKTLGKAASALKYCQASYLLTGNGEQCLPPPEMVETSLCFSGPQLAQKNPWLGSMWRKNSLYVVSTPVRFNKAQFYSKLTSQPTIKLLWNQWLKCHQYSPGQTLPQLSLLTVNSSMLLNVLKLCSDQGS